MKFNYVIGNPPYQQESEKKSKVNGQTRRKNIFQHFQMEADKIASDSTVLIYPGARWIHQSGKGVEKFGKDQINDKSLSKLIYYPDTKEVFGSGIGIDDGISIVVKNKHKTDGGFNYEFHNKGSVLNIHSDNPGESLLPLNPQDVSLLSKIEKVIQEFGLKVISDSVYSQKLFGIESDFVTKNPNKVVPYTGQEIDYSANVKIFTNDKAGASGRTKWFVCDKTLIPQNSNLINEWQVVVSSAHPGGQAGRDNQLEIIDNHSAFGRARVAIKSFKTKEEAINFYSYMKTLLVRYTFLMTDEALTSLGKRVPDFIDYSSNNKLLDFSMDLNEQLYELFGLEASEQVYLQTLLEDKKGAR